MSDPLNYCNIADLKQERTIDDMIADLPDEISTDYDPKFIDIEVKNGDELLIELYKERPFLYDKSNISFKDLLMKQSAWIEISKIMKTNYGDIYTPLYCQKRCTSLRDQYSREKRKAETEPIHESTAVTSRFPLFSQLAFLDHVIKRRRSYRKFQLNIVDEDSNTHESQSTANESGNEGNENVTNQHIHNSKNFNTEKDASKVKKQKVNETKECLKQTLEQILVQMRHIISTYMEKKVLTADEAFMEFIKAQFNSIPEKEKNIRRKMIMDVLAEPLPEKY